MPYTLYANIFVNFSAKFFSKIFLQQKNAQAKGMKKRMECKAPGEVKYRSNLMVVRILTRRVTQQSAFYSPRQSITSNPV